MPPNELLFWLPILLAWALSVAVAYFAGKAKAFKQAESMVDQIMGKILRDKLNELKNKPKQAD